MASVKKKTRAHKKQASKRNVNRIKVGKLATYQSAVKSKLRDVDEFKKFVNDSLATYAMFLDGGEIFATSEVGKTIIEVCDLMYSDLQRFNTDIQPALETATKFLVRKTATIFEMHLESLGIITDISSHLDEHTRLLQLSLERLNQLELPKQ